MLSLDQIIEEYENAKDYPNTLADASGGLEVTIYRVKSSDEETERYTRIRIENIEFE